MRKLEGNMQQYAVASLTDGQGKYLRNTGQGHSLVPHKRHGDSA